MPRKERESEKSANSWMKKQKNGEKNVCRHFLLGVCGVRALVIYWALRLVFSQSLFLSRFHFPFWHITKIIFTVLFKFLITGIILFERTLSRFPILISGYLKDAILHENRTLLIKMLFLHRHSKITQSGVLLTLCNIISNWTENDESDLFMTFFVVVVVVVRPIITVTSMFQLPKFISIVCICDSHVINKTQNEKQNVDMFRQPSSSQTMQKTLTCQVDHLWTLNKQKETEKNTRIKKWQVNELFYPHSHQFKMWLTMKKRNKQKRKKTKKKYESQMPIGHSLFSCCCYRCILSKFPRYRYKLIESIT